MKHQPHIGLQVHSFEVWHVAFGDPALRHVRAFAVLRRDVALVHGAMAAVLPGWRLDGTFQKEGLKIQLSYNALNW